jgi:hypothetical protein
VKYLTLFLLLFSWQAWTKVQFELIAESSQLKQGEITTARLLVKESQGQSVLSGLNGKNLGQTLYLLSLTPFVGKQGLLESEAKIIFLKVPQSNSVTEIMNGEEIIVVWNNLTITPTETSKSFLLGDFEIPEVKELLPYLAAILVMSIGVAAFFWYRRRTNKRKLMAKKRQILKEELLNCLSYDDVVSMWKQKRKYLQEFQQLDPHFKDLEVTLFKFQFKPQRSETELHQVIEAYQKFKSDIAGVLNGI